MRGNGVGKKGDWTIFKKEPNQIRRAWPRRHSNIWIFFRGDLNDSQSEGLEVWHLAYYVELVHGDGAAGEGPLSLRPAVLRSLYEEKRDKAGSQLTITV